MTIHHTQGRLLPTAARFVHGSFVLAAAFMPQAGPLAPQASAAPLDRPSSDETLAIPMLGKPGRFLMEGDLLDLGVQSLERAVKNRTYQLGSEWGKVPVTADTLRNSTPAFRRAALATARAGGATSFVLGEFDGSIVMATNHHVFPSAEACQGRAIAFTALSIEGRCLRFIGTWPSIDLTLFTLEVADPEVRSSLLGVAANFDFATPLRQGQDLITVGYGVGNNPGRQLVANADGDCKVFSATGSFRLMPDPDALNPGEYEAWSFANACDVSHGDSGSAMVDRVTGRPVGIIWTGKIPKAAEVQSSDYLAQLLVQQSEEVWSELSYAVPAVKIQNVLTEASNDSGRDAADRAVLQALVADQP